LASGEHAYRSIGGRVYAGARPHDRIQRSYVDDVFEYCILGLLLALLYKLTAVVLILMVLISALGILTKSTGKYVFKPLSLFAILYVYLAMGTAFLTSWNDGFYRNVQFLLVLFAALGISKFLFWADEARLKRLIERFTICSVVVLIHMIIYHMYIGNFVTWKYLYDTKTIISICVVLLFLNEDVITRRLAYAGWFWCLVTSAVLVLMSGERKAYLLFVVLFAFSRTPAIFKGILGVATGLALMIFAVSAGPGDYVVQQLNSAFESERQMHISEFYSIQDVADHSDLIREFVNRNARQLFLDNPVFGVGADGYKAWSRQMFGSLDESNGLSMGVHGEINRVPAEEGLVGIAVASIFVLLSISAIVLHLRTNGGLRTPSAKRAPLYIFTFLLLYASFEASDTFMLIMILVFGIEMARLHDRNLLRAMRQGG
jgi:hypothetical protein